MFEMIGLHVMGINSLPNKAMLLSGIPIIAIHYVIIFFVNYEQIDNIFVVTC